VAGDDDLAGPDAAGAADQEPVTGAQGGQHGTFGDLDPLQRPVHPSLRGLLQASGVVSDLQSQRVGERESMRLLTRLLEPKTVAHAHCDLPCGVYDPAQARIEAESVKAIIEKYQQNTDPEFRTRCLIIKEQRSELVKHHLWVLWTDYFKPPHFEKYPQLNQLFNEATKLAGAAGTKGTVDVAKADELLGKIEEIGKVFWETKQG
jgi:nickel superoxide dismutase